MWPVSDHEEGGNNVANVTHHYIRNESIRLHENVETYPTLQY